LQVRGLPCAYDTLDLSTEKGSQSGPNVE